MACPFTSTATAQQHERIPQPPEHLFGLLGNIPDIDPSFIFKEIWKLMNLYGPVLKMNIPGETIFVGDREHVNEMCDEERFHKHLTPTLIELRALLGDGLFTAYEEEKTWGMAHRLLTPSFGPLGVRKMFDSMLDISTQLVLKWDRLGPEHEIDCSDDLTKLAFDTIGLCAFSFRFNQFYTDDIHPFPRKMGEVLLESGKRATRPRMLERFYSRAEQARQEKVRDMHQLCDDIIADRKKYPQPDNHDLLNEMLNGVDRETGEKLSDENIRFQFATMLVAGHETTSSTLSFAYYNFLKNPDVLLKAQQQVDEVVGDSVLNVDHLPKLTYIDACIKETLRLSSPINGWAVSPRDDLTFGGKFQIPKDCPMFTSLHNLHTDPSAWGEDSQVFRPERLLDGGFQNLPANAWKPFGNGSRACIGRGFAMQEMIMNIALVLQRFQIEMADPTYNLELKSTLTIKPTHFRMKVRRRPGKSMNVGIPGGASADASVERKHQHAGQSRELQKTAAKPVNVFFGGNTGTCEAMAQSLQNTAAENGLDVFINGLDAATEALTDDRPTVIITASYEGHPPENAKKFVAWLEKMDKENSPLQSKKYAVFGVGNSDWANTFHRIPKLVDDQMAAAGASRIVDPGFCDVKVDMIGPFEEWADKICEALAETLSVEVPTDSKSRLEISIRSSTLSETLAGGKVTYGTVMSNQELAGSDIGPAKRNIDIRLPDDVEYLAGDYLVIVPQNPMENVERVLVYFALSPHDTMAVKNTSKKFLPGEPMPVGEFLMTAVELSNPITKRQLTALKAYAKSEHGRTEMERLYNEYNKVLQKRLSILDVLEETHVELPFSQFVDMLPPLTPRQYSIASSPMQNRGTASLCFDVHESPALSGHGMFHGVASTYLASRRVGDRITCFVRPTNVGFRMPNAEIPVMMMAAGTGIAPMRAFLQERAAVLEAGVRKLGPAVLYFGCRDPDRDFIYKEELEEWEGKGVVKVRTAFSKSDGKYVPDLVWEDRDQCAEMFRNNGKIFLCGSAARLGRSVADVCKKIKMERTGDDEKAAEEWLQSVKTDRYVSDVY